MTNSNWPRQRGFDRFYGTLPGYGSLYNPAGLYDNNKPITPSNDYFYTDALADNDHRLQIKTRTEAERPTRTDRRARRGTDQPTNPSSSTWHSPPPTTPSTPAKKPSASTTASYDKGWDQLREDRRFARLKKSSASFLRPAPPLPLRRDEGSIPWADDPEPTMAGPPHASLRRHGRRNGPGHRPRPHRPRRATEQLADTLVVFLSDNGGSPEGHLDNTIERIEKPWVSSLTPKTTRTGEPVIPGDIPGLDIGPENTFGSYGLRWASLSNTPFRRHKAWMHEGGIATPCIVHWPEGDRTRPTHP